MFPMPPNHPPKKTKSVYRKLLGGGEWWCDDLHRRKTCNSCFCCCSEDDESFFPLFSHKLPFDLTFYINGAESKLVPPPLPPSRYGILIKNPTSCVFIHRKHAAADPSAALYKTNLPTTTPTRKKSTMRATERALNPSSFFMATEACWDDMMLLFLILTPSSPCQTKEVKWTEKLQDQRNVWGEDVVGKVK